ncbi:glycosyltransferase [Marinobacter segnicrescens]|uniref:glycosyltransferase n=1 Tax=Marinobacter segnicrescens TaxID=430453 RepID=UPI003A8E9A6B
MDKVHIMHLTFNMCIGGTEQVIRTLVTNLPIEIYENQVVCIDGYVGEIGKLVEREGIPVSYLSRHPGFDWALVRELRRKIQSDRIDIVHCHQYTPWIYGWLACLGTGARVVMTEHGRFYPDRYRYKALLVNPIMALLTHRIVAISSATRDSLAQYEFIPKAKIEVIYNGVARVEPAKDEVRQRKQELGIPQNELIMGTVARLDPVKNQPMMLEAFDRVLKQHPHSWLLIVGDGPDRPKLEAMSRDLGIDGRVIFVGFIDQPATYLAAMDLFLLTSNTEGTSMTLLEAMSLGIPSVLTEVGGNAEIIEQGKTGILTPIGDAEAFAEAISRFIMEPELMEDVGQRAQQVYFEQFSVASMVESYQQLYWSERSVKAVHE